jgi:folate-binding protein YgfZ
VTTNVCGISNGRILPEVTSQLVDRHELAQLEALERERAFAELRGWRFLAVRGADARGWLHDLITADVRTLGPGTARRSLVLSPTGRIRADLHVALQDDGFLLLQDPIQPDPAEAILTPYILSSDVELIDVSRRLATFAVLGGDVAQDGATVWSPSPLGVGTGVVVDAGEPAGRLRTTLASDRLEALPEALERWRIRRGIPRMGADFDTDALPAEAGLEGTIDFTKGCFLGQESVAKVRNLGHPPRAILSVRSGTRLEVGMPVRSGDLTVGEVTSVAADDASLGIVRVRWGAAGGALVTPAGPLSLR